MTDIIKLAKDFARKRHGDQKDDCGFNYFKTHVCQVATLVCLVTNDKDLIAAAYLHDTLEDTKTSLIQLKELFGSRIASLVYELTHDGKKDSWGYYFPRLQSRDAILIKFADRLSNLSRMDSWNEKRRAQYLRKSVFWRKAKK